MNSTSLNNPIYNFVVRWLFSTNHKCEVLVSLYQRALSSANRPIPLNRTTPLKIHNKKVKRLFLILLYISIEKRTFMMASPICGAGDRIENLIRLFPALSNNLLCGIKDWSLCLRLKSNRYSVALSQSLGDTKLRLGTWGYDYKSGVRKIHSRMFEKPFGSTAPKKECSTASQSKSKESSLVSLSGDSKKLWEFRNQKGKHNTLINIISDPDTLVAAYEEIKSNSVNITFMVSHKTLETINDKWFDETTRRLKDGSFQFKSAKRIVIFKPNKLDKQLLTIGNFKDKIVQQAIRMVLEQIFEPEFLQASQGCHSALKQIKTN
jgi:hypothetical protein